MFLKLCQSLCVCVLVKKLRPNRKYQEFDFVCLFCMEIDFTQSMRGRSSNRVSNTVWLHHLYSNERLREEARWKLHKDAVCCFERILEATPYKTVVVRPFTSHLENQEEKRTRLSEHSW